MADDNNDLTWSITNRGYYKIHERAGHRRIAPRSSEEATRFVASLDLLEGCEFLLKKLGHTIFAKFVAKDEFEKIRKAVTKARGMSR